MKIKLTESKLKQVIAESVKKVIKETHENYIWDLIDELKEALGPDELINRICGRLDSMTLSKMLNDIKEVELNNYSIDNEEE